VPLDICRMHKGTTMPRIACFGVSLGLMLVLTLPLAAAPRPRAAVPAPEATLGSIVYSGWEWLMSPGRHAGHAPPGMPQPGQNKFPDWCKQAMSPSVDAVVPFYVRDQANCYKQAKVRRTR
jgi:hypothetical protein